MKVDLQMQLQFQLKNFSLKRETRFFHMKSAAEEALNSFGEAKLQDIAPIEIPFSSKVHDPKTSRNEYITLKIIKYGATPNCRACAFSSEHSTRSPICRACFNGLIRAGRMA